jgi:hypothetical protein
VDRKPWTLDRGPQMQNAKPTTRLFFLLTAYCLLATDNGQLLSHGRVHWWTSARKTPKKSHLVSLFRAWFKYGVFRVTVRTKNVP